MKRILFTLIAIFAIVSLAHGQTPSDKTLSYNSPDPFSVVLSNQINTEGTDTIYTDVDLYMLKNFKADEDDNGFTCEDGWILQGNEEEWDNIWEAKNVSFF